MSRLEKPTKATPKIIPKLSQCRKEIPLWKCKAILRESEEAAIEYQSYKITDKYGQRYLDPAKCEANNYDPIKASKEEDMRLRLLVKYCTDICSMCDQREARKVLLSLTPERSKKKQSGSSSEAPYIPKQTHIHIEKRTKSKIISSVSSAAQRIIPKRVQKRSGKQSRREAISLLCKAAQLVGCDVDIGDTHVKVVAAKITEDSVMLDVKEEVEEGAWDQYDIEYNTDMKPR
ncbi:uncharacterized protein VTP21DRAFT_4163 [Calcarisporiella thermophila]|uniref:uncharacterized protein n=1 Tax=Calcarisporiella thermophila TaxID=911321 RepID=UPI0037426F39